MGGLPDGFEPTRHGRSQDLRALNADPVATDKGGANFAVLEAVLVLLLEEKNLANIDCIFARDWNLAVPPCRMIGAIE